MKTVKEQKHEEQQNESERQQ